MLHDPGLLAEARRIRGAGDDDARLRARRFIEQASQAGERQRPEWLSYEQAAACLDGSGRHEEAALVRDLAQITARLADTAQRWLHRYSERADTAGQREDRLALAAGLGSAWDEPYTGIDGVLYTPGVCRFWQREAPVVLAEARVAVELITGFESGGDARRWARDDRCAADLRPLVPPPGVRALRIVQEEQILSALLRRPGELAEVVDWLPATTFTADVRYEIFAAIRASHLSRDDSIAARFGGPGIDLITSQLLRRLAWSPDWDNPRLGGPGTPLANVYLHRLASTDVDTGMAAQAARRLATEDARAMLAEGRSGVAQLPSRPAAPGPAHRSAMRQAELGQPGAAGLMKPPLSQRPHQLGRAPQM